MRSRNPAVYLADVQRAAAAIASFIDGETLETYSQDMKLRSAVERQFEIIGEAMAQLRTAHPEILERIAAAHAIIGFRNQLIHGYALVDDEIVWGNTLRLPLLLIDVEREIAVLDWEN